MTSEIAVRAEIVRADAYEPRGIEDAWSLAETLHRSGLLPRGMARPEAVLYSLIAGRELGLTATQSLRSLHVVEGKIVLAADLIVALIKRNKSVCKYFRLVESTPLLARYETLRADEPEPTAMTWTFEQATKAGLTGKDNWRKYPDAMLRARCSAYLARAVYPDLAMGMYDPDEADEFGTGSRGRARSVAAQPANTQTEADAQETDASPATALDKLVDDLRSASTPEGIRASYETHAREIAEMDTAGYALSRARDACHAAVIHHGFGSNKADTDRILGKGEVPAAKAAPAPQAPAAEEDWRDVDLLSYDEDHATTGALKSALRDAPDATKVITCWREAAPEVKTLDERSARACFSALVARWAQLMPTLDGVVAEKAVRAALKSDPDGPKPGTRKPRAVAPVADVQGAAGEASATPSATMQARAPLAESFPYAQSADQWDAHLASKPSAYAVAGSFGRHAPAFRDAGAVTYAKRLRAAVGRHMALSGLDEGKCEAIMLAAERDADAAAAVAAQALASGKSETAVRREKRDAAERPMAKVA